MFAFSFRFVFILVAMLAVALAGLVFPPDAEAVVFGSAKARIARANARGDARVARLQVVHGVHGANVRGARVFVAPGGATVIQSSPRVFVDGFGRTVIIP